MGKFLETDLAEFAESDNQESRKVLVRPKVAFDLLETELKQFGFNQYVKLEQAFFISLSATPQQLRILKEFQQIENIRNNGTVRALPVPGRIGKPLRPVFTDHGRTVIRG